jgi:hypothetical protein
LHRARRRLARAFAQAGEPGGSDPDTVTRATHCLPGMEMRA